MYDFHYGFIKKKYDKKAQLVFTDTDSLTYEIKQIIYIKIYITTKKSLI